MDLSVIIINYNTYQLTRKCIASVYEKTEGVAYEVILVDNASTECDPELFKQEFPRLKLIKSTTNTGFSGGNNLGLAVASGKFLLLLNSDTELLNNALYLACQQMRQHEDIGVLSGQLQFPDGSLQHPASHFPSLALDLAQLTRVYNLLPSKVRRSWYLNDQWNHHLDTDADWVWGAFFLTRRHIVDQLPGGKLPDDFFMYAEDMQWCHAIRQLGYRIHYSSAPKCVHHIGGSDKEKAASADERMFSKTLPNELKLMAHIHGPWYPVFWLFLRSVFYKTLRQENANNKAKRYWQCMVALVQEKMAT